MNKFEEESKGSTCGEESEQESDTNPEDLPKSGLVAAKVMPGVYLSTNLLTEKNMTLADINIESCTLEVIEIMEAELIGMVQKLRSKPIMIDPKAELKKRK